MRIIVFKCSENMNNYQEEFKFADNITDEQINEEFADWVWEQVSDSFTWYENK